MPYTITVVPPAETYHDDGSVTVNPGWTYRRTCPSKQDVRLALLRDLGMDRLPLAGGIELPDGGRTLTLPDLSTVVIEPC